MSRDVMVALLDSLRQSEQDSLLILFQVLFGESRRQRQSRQTCLLFCRSRHSASGYIALFGGRRERRRQNYRRVTVSAPQPLFPAASYARTVTTVLPTYSGIV